MDKKELEKQIELLVKDDERNQQTIIKQSEEIERLNNIITELEKWLNEEYEATIFDYHNAIEDVLNKLKELKGSDKE